MNDLLMALLGYGGAPGNYGATGAPSGGYGGLFQPQYPYGAAQGQTFTPQGYQPAPPGYGYMGTQVGYPAGSTDPNSYSLQPIGGSGGVQGYMDPGGPMPTPWQMANATPMGNGGPGNTQPIGGMPAGNNKGGPSAGQGGTPGGAPTGVGSPGWIATHPDYKAPPNPGAGPLTFNPTGGPFAGRDQFGRYPATAPRDGTGGGVGSPSWIATHPNYKTPL